MNFEDAKKLGWKFEYVSAIGCCCLFNPEKKLVFKDINNTATYKTLEKYIKIDEKPGSN